MPQKLLGNVRGKDGSPATVSFVEPVSLPSGSKPTLENLGSNTNAVLRFGIPSGSQGAPGANGRNGVDGQDGQSITGPRGRAATLKINSVEMLDSDADPEVVSIGNETDAEYILKLPRAVGSVPDEELIENSTNTVQSKAIQEALDLKADSSSIPTKVSELTNDKNYVSETSVNVMIEDAVEAAVTAANPIDNALSDTSTRPVQNKAITSAIGEKATMTVEDALDNTQTKYGEIVTLSNADKEVSLVLTGQNIETVVLSQNFAERIPTIVSELPTEGSLDRLYLVPSSGDNYSMHIWMEVNGVEKWVNIQSGGNVDLSGYASKSEAIKNITRNGITFTATRADDTTFTFTQQEASQGHSGMIEYISSSSDGSESVFSQNMSANYSQYFATIFSVGGMFVRGVVRCEVKQGVYVNVAAGATFLAVSIIDASAFGVDTSAYNYRSILPATVYVGNNLLLEQRCYARVSITRDNKIEIVIGGYSSENETIASQGDVLWFSF